MTEQIKSAISIIENEKKCVQSDCDRDCSRCELVKEESEIVGGFDLAIRSLQAWEEVLQKLEYFDVNEYLKDEGHRFGFNEGICYVMELINQKLSEIEEVR